jgi:hypothetical protein
MISALLELALPSAIVLAIVYLCMGTIPSALLIAVIWVNAIWAILTVIMFIVSLFLIGREVSHKSSPPFAYHTNSPRYAS